MIAAPIFLLAVIVAVFLRGNAGTLENKNPLQSLFPGGETTSTRLYAQNPRFPEDAEVKSLSFTAEESFVKPLGRTMFDGFVRWFSMSGSGISFLCDGDEATITCEVFNSQYITYSHRPRVIVFVNGEKTSDVVLDGESEEISVDLTGFDGDCEVRLVKASEAMYSTVGVSKIDVEAKGDICPAPERSLKIEFIGDSITCGYGLDEEGSSEFSTRTENFTETYAFLASEELEADCYAVSFSGYGVLTGFPTNGQANDYVIFKYYDAPLVDCESLGFNPYWDFSKLENDLVVINLGTNDASYCFTEERTAAFRDEYKRLLTLVRARNPKAYILCVLGDMNNSLYSDIEQAVAEYKTEDFDPNVKCATLSFDMGTFGSVIDGHPTKQSNELAAKTLTEEIRGFASA